MSWTIREYFDQMMNSKSLGSGFDGAKREKAQRAWPGLERRLSSALSQAGVRTETWDLGGADIYQTECQSHAVASP